MKTHLVVSVFVIGVIIFNVSCKQQPESTMPLMESTRSDADRETAVAVGDNIITNSIGMKLRLIQPGTFMMGSPSDEKDRDGDETQHEVVLTKPYYIGVYEVTQAEFEEVMGINPSYWKGANLPVECVSWNEAVEFCEKLSAKEPGATYRLPTEAEWEYACRAGEDTRFYWGNDLDYSQIGLYAFYDNNSGGQTNEVGQKESNKWGLYDMIGNVSEWCQDWYGDYPTGKLADPVGASNQYLRVLRGGSCLSNAENCRSASRYSEALRSLRNGRYGFRVVRTP